jgi:hypothetical protein
MSSNGKRSTGALIAALVLVVVGSTLVDVVLHLVHFYPAWDAPIDDVQSLVATLYRAAISVAGAYLCAALAPNRPMRHVMILGGIGTVLGTLGAVGTWDKGLGPHWYPIALAVLAVPQSWLGGMLFTSRHKES